MEIHNASDKSISKFIRSLMPKETTDEDLKEAEMNFKRYLGYAFDVFQKRRVDNT